MAPKRRRGRGEGAVFYSASKRAWVGRAIVGAKPSGKPRYKEVTAQAKGDVLAKMRAAEEAARGGLPSDARPLTVGQYLQHWLDNVAKPSVRETTWESYERCVRLHLKDQLGGIKLADLRPPHVEAYFAGQLKEGMSRGNAKKVGEVLASALEHAARTGLIRSNPSSPITKPQPEEEEIVPFTPAEAKAVLAAAEGLRLEALFHLAFATGARQGELLGLGWDHVDLDRGAVRIERSLAVVKAVFD
jgi:integrase